MGRRCIRHNISVPLTYEQPSLPATQVNGFRFPWFCGKTEVQIGFMSADSSVGEFLIPFAFGAGPILQLTPYAISETGLG